MTASSSNPRPDRWVARWRQRFADAFSGLGHALRTQENMRVHLIVATGVVATAALLQLELWRWCVLLLCIGHVFAAEIINSSIETFVRHFQPQRSIELANTLHQAAAAVLVSAIMAVIIGLLVIVPPLVAIVSP